MHITANNKKGGIIMDLRNEEEIRNTVMERYGKIARTQVDIPGEENTGTCATFSAGIVGEKQQISCCCQKDFSADTISEIVGYTKEEMKNVPEGANMGLGCGNPVALASVKPGETVVDLGSGGGFDCFLASGKVGDTGRVIGVDMTPDMIKLARKNKEKSGTKNVDFRLGEIEHLPVEDNTADLIISNCVINLSPQKGQVYRDAFRVLKPGGRLAVSDILAQKPLPEHIQRNLSLVSACVGGAATIVDTRKMLMEVGFEEISITPRTFDPAFMDELIPGSNVGEYVVSANIQARKPL